jgi:hypothetical protein
MPSYLVETYLSRAAVADLPANERRIRSAAAELAREGTRVRFDRVIHVPGDELCFYVVEAPSAQDAERAAERAGLRALRVAEATSSRKEKPA